MKHFPIVPIILSCMLLLTVSCQDYQELLPKGKANKEGVEIKTSKVKVNNVLEVDIPNSLKNLKLLQNNHSSNWLVIQNSIYEGEMMLSTGEDGHISSIKVRGEIANHIEKTYLVDTFGDANSLRWDDPVPQLEPIECFMDCMRGQPLNGYIVAGCLVICGWKSI